MDSAKLTEYLDSLTSDYVPSVDCIVYKEHKEIYRHMSGKVDFKHTVPVSHDTMYLMFSMTKVITMTSVLMLIEAGKLSLEDRVDKYLPAYKNLMVKEGDKVVPAKNPLLIKHLVSMQSGLDYDLNRPGIVRVLDKKGAAATTQDIVNAFPESPLMFHPGTHFLYSLSHDVCAAVVEVVSGMKFSEFLKKNIFEPLGMKRTFFAKPDNNLDNLADQYIFNESAGKPEPMEKTCNYQLSECYESGGAGLISCTEDYAVLADTLASGGISKDGVRILKAETVELIKQNLLCEEGLKDISTLMGRVGYGYGIGMQVLMNRDLNKAAAPNGVFGWDGAAGSCIIMDTKSKTSLVYTMHVRGCGPAYGVIHPTLRDLVFG